MTMISMQVRKKIIKMKCKLAKMMNQQIQKNNKKPNDSCKLNLKCRNSMPKYNQTFLNVIINNINNFFF